MKQVKGHTVWIEWKSTLGVILRPRLYNRRLYEELSLQLPYKPSAKDVRRCYRDFGDFE